MRTTIWLARHGETDWAVEDRYNGRAESRLTRCGRIQAEGLARRLAREPLSAVYCSPLERCVQTARVAAAPHRLKPVPHAGLVEIDYGAWDGMLRREIVETYPALYAAWVADPVGVVPPGGELGYAALARAVQALRGIAVDHAGTSVLVVAHKAINRLLLCDALGVEPRLYRARIGQLPCALNCIELCDGEPMVTLLNDTSHHTCGGDE